MPNLDPQQATFLLQTYLPALKNERRVTTKVISAIPLDKGDYRPEPVAMSALDLAWHIVSAENRFLDGIIAGAFSFTGGGRPASLRDSADIVAWYGENFDPLVEKLSQLSGEHLARTIDFRGVLQLPAVSYLPISMHHAVHHRGQLSTYLRPMGSKVPSIYGESYDDAEARRAAAAR